MSILIRGMDMPKRCEDCLLCYDGFYCKALDVSFYDKREWSGGLVPEGFDHCQSILPNCPLAPVPPHGRLIDADVAEAIYFTGEDADGKDFYDGILYAADFISEQPTIIPADSAKHSNKDDVIDRSLEEIRP